ncbi:nickel-dependent hydrogenase large subunit [Methylomonas sp. SURF-2]|uniref:Nickel-dependent hydrogenase large subunit n=1 Tax=Methylomonas subterranea TaxID=2952225 RepID=A0ABT1TED2_9GAMM|nr:nickel-dependent hydrogenase large subunit [Methylomonas sp. SURF-2]MCQ8103812.1 nickel-dependent hydrogenase large subunit [Methylomonas sp. SURF-2]
MSRRTIQIEMNRVEGDLDFQLDLEDNVVVDARCIGTLYRGFEQIMLGRKPTDSLVITPRICGICGTAQLNAAVLALEQVGRIPVPPNAVRIRNLCLMAETVQSDLRQSFLFFTADFCHPKYQNRSFYPKALAAFQPFKGSVHRGALENSRHIVEIVALFGGQWPHSSYMLPGGVTTSANSRHILDSLSILNRLTRWFEQSVTGADLDAWLDLQSAEQFFAWLSEKAAHADSAIGLFTLISREVGLHRLGFGTPHMLSYGAYDDPLDADTFPPHNKRLFKAGFLNGETGDIEPFDQAGITEHVRHAWFQQYPGGRHPFQGETVPDYQPHSDRYTWCKAPRYQDKVVQTGPLADALIDGDALIVSLYRAEGGNAWLRQFARLRRTAKLLRGMRETLLELAANLDEPHMLAPADGDIPDGEGFGLVTAARGGLGHWLQISDGAISRYQVVTPTAWNASPKDSAGRHGHWESSLIGMRVDDPDDPLEIGHIIRSHDPCLVCTVHILDTGKRVTLWP